MRELEQELLCAERKLAPELVALEMKKAQLAAFADSMEAVRSWQCKRNEEKARNIAASILGKQSKDVYVRMFVWRRGEGAKKKGLLLTPQASRVGPF